MTKILLSAVGGSVSISFINHLKEKGYFVIGMDINDNIPAKYFCDEFVKAPNVDSDDYLSFLQNIDFDLFFPWLDEEHIKFALMKENPLYQNMKERIITSDPETILSVTDKRKLYKKAVLENINVSPETFNVPAFVRKNFSRGSKNAYVEYKQEKLDLLDTDSFIAQEVLHGEEYTVDVLTDLYGNFIYAVPRKRIKFSNVSLVGEVDMNENIISFAKKIVSLFNFRGPINIQLIIENGKMFLVEINPRIAGSSILSVKAGFDILSETVSLFMTGSCNTSFNIIDKLKMYRYITEKYV